MRGKEGKEKQLFRQKYKKGKDFENLR